MGCGEIGDRFLTGWAERHPADPDMDSIRRLGGLSGPWYGSG